MPKTAVKSDKAPAKAPPMIEGCGDAASQMTSAQNEPGVCYAPRPRRRPSALDYLVSESPTTTPKAALEAAYKGFDIGAHRVSTQSHASAPSALNGHIDDARGTAVGLGPRIDWASSHARPGDMSSIPGYRRSQTFSDLYSSPATAHSHAPMPSAPLSHAAPSMLQLGYGTDKAPMSGYQLLAQKLVGGLGGPPVTPVYRRFEALHHRLLLYMQADLLELENELRTLDAKDTMERGYGMIPASRRHERWMNSSLAQQRMEILGQIGYKLSQYNKVMASLRKTQDMAAPSFNDVLEYKAYLASNRLVADEETKSGRRRTAAQRR
ncbi:hypothetical protein CDD83_1657 [Cordyceps sp. RAO-2017]|nr:hypothetical protein CDD83_1657 [Cordyceps sp. RAO-2017]